MKYNLFTKPLWLWQARRKIHSDDDEIRYNAIFILGDIGKEKDISILEPLLHHNHHNTRNVAARAILSINKRYDADLISPLIENYSNELPLTTQLAYLEVFKGIPLEQRVSLLSPFIGTSEDDLLYAIIAAIRGVKDLDILDSILQVSDNPDMVLRRLALEVWYQGLSEQKIDDVLDYCTPRLHELIRINYELQLDGKFLKDILSYANIGKLPTPKAYPDFIIRYLNELIRKWEYNPEANRALHAIVVPSYFTFDETGDNRPYIIL